MSERGLPSADGAHACPFVAFEDDRDERATIPDHRHRCYADVKPSPRALAHQEAYCLSSSFPVCPTFQDWARRESARARDARDAATSAAASAANAAGAATAPHSPASMAHPATEDDDNGPTETRIETAPADRADIPVARSAGAAAAGAAAAGAAASAGAAATGGVRDEADSDDQADFGAGEPRRNPPRDWSAPPPWLASSEAAERGAPSDPPNFLAHRSEPGRGLAGSAADQLAGGPPPRPTRPSQPAHHGSHVPFERDDDGEVDFEERDLPRPALAPRRPRAYDQHLGGPSSGPDWERPRRYEAYPTIRTRVGVPAVPRLGVLAAAIAVAALAFFFLPGLLGLGTGEQAAPSSSPSAAPSPSIEPTAPPSPTATIYRIKSGDTLLKIAKANGITIEQLLAANPDIKNPNRIVVGQEITIPPPEGAIPEDFGGSAAPSGEPAP